VISINESLKYIEIETCSSCTRSCKWCLFGNYKDFRGKENKYLETKYIQSVFRDLTEINFKGTIALYGINEPLLDERISSGYLIGECKKYLADNVNISIFTNGDMLESYIIDNMYNAGVGKLTVSCYDDEVYEKAIGFKKMYKNINILDQRRYQLGDWESNRAGALSGVINPKPSRKTCFMQFFRTVVGWDGEIRLCPHEAVGIFKLGNIKSERFIDILTKEEYTSLREELVRNRKNIYPCKDCSIDGSLQYMLGHMHEKREVLDIIRLINKSKKDYSDLISLK
jgi:radical SAM protein with 4Fe4S-binding SPASM domain